MNDNNIKVSAERGQFLTERFLDILDILTNCSSVDGEMISARAACMVYISAGYSKTDFLGLMGEYFDIVKDNLDAINNIANKRKNNG